MITAAKLKAESCDLCFMFVKVFANFQQSGIGEKDKESANEDYDGDQNEKAYVFSSEFLYLCYGDMRVYYFYSCCSKFCLLKLSVISLLSNALLNGSSSHISITVARRKEREDMNGLSEVLSAPVIKNCSERELLDKLKRQKFESEAYDKLQEGRILYSS